MPHPAHLTIITPTYAYDRFADVLHRGIQSIWSQQPHGLHVHHVIVFDGDADPRFQLNDAPDWYSYEVHGTPRTAVWGIAQRNFGMQFIRPGWVWFFDHDNLAYDSALAEIERHLAPPAGVLFFPVWHIHANERKGGKPPEKIIIPRPGEPVPRYTQVDSLNFIVHSELANLCEWQEKWGHDFLYIQGVIALGEQRGYRLVQPEYILGEHS